METLLNKMVLSDRTREQAARRRYAQLLHLGDEAPEAELREVMAVLKLEPADVRRSAELVARCRRLAPIAAARAERLRASHAAQEAFAAKMAEVIRRRRELEQEESASRRAASEASRLYSESCEASGELDSLRRDAPWLFFDERGEAEIPAWGGPLPQDLPAAIDERLLALDPAEWYSVDILRDRYGVHPPHLVAAKLPTAGGGGDYYWGASVIGWARAIRDHLRERRREALRAMIIDVRATINHLDDGKIVKAPDVEKLYGIPDKRLAGIPTKSDGYTGATLKNLAARIREQTAAARAELAQMDAEDGVTTAAAEKFDESPVQEPAPAVAAPVTAVESGSIEEGLAASAGVQNAGGHAESPVRSRRRAR